MGVGTVRARLRSALLSQPRAAGALQLSSTQ